MHEFDFGTVEQWAVFTLALLTFAFSGWRWALGEHQKINATINSQVEKRESKFDRLSDRAELKYAEASRRDAELSERITAMRAEQIEKMQPYVTRAELDRRIEKLEDAQVLGNAKLDAILHRLAGVKHP